MARFTPGAVVTALSGKIASAVFAKGSTGGTVRMRSQGKSYRTGLQSLYLSRLGAISSAWRELTEAQRSEWNNAANNFFRHDSLGQRFKLTGKSLFVSVNQNRASISSSLLTTPPLPVEFPAVTLFVEASSAENSMSVFFGPSPLPSGFRLHLYASRQMSPGTSSFKYKQLRLIASVQSGRTSPEPLGQIYNSFYPSVANSKGQKIFFQTRWYSETTGLLSAGYNTFLIVT